MRNKIKTYSVILAVLSVGLGSCLKDSPYMDVSNTQPIIEFGLGPSTAPLYLSYPQPYTVAVGTAATDTTVALVVASPSPLGVGHPVTITVKFDTGVLNAYNAANGTSLIPLPTSLFTLVDTATIATNHVIGRIKVHFNFPAFDFTKSYAFPLSISNGDGLIISGNNSTFIWTFSRP